MRILAFDADQVLLDFCGHWQKCAEEVLEREVHELSQEFSLNRKFGLEQKDANKVWLVFNTPERWGSIPLLDGVDDMLDGLLGFRCQIHVITSVPNIAVKARLDFFADRFPGISVHQAESLDKSKLNGAPTKFQWLRMIAPEFYADDRWQHCREAVDAGVPSVFRVHGGHHGDGAPLHGIPVVNTVQEALSEHFRM